MIVPHNASPKQKEKNDSSIISESDPLLLEVTINQLNETVLHLVNEVETLKSRIEVLEKLGQTEDYPAI